jgi:hypothetical protein
MGSKNKMHFVAIQDHHPMFGDNHVQIQPHLTAFLCLCCWCGRISPGFLAISAARSLTLRGRDFAYQESLRWSCFASNSIVIGLF